MTLPDAAALAALSLLDRRLVALVIRLARGRGTPEELDALPPRAADEPLSVWACRLRAVRTRSPWQDLHRRLTQAADRHLDAARRAGIVPLILDAPEYPARLAAIPDPPPVLWVQGTPDALARPGVALVGSRSATAGALAIARQLAGELAAAGLVVVSGLARGVDSAAHRGALAAGGCTVGVLGCGPDTIYPPEHAELAGEMAASGAVVSELPPGTRPSPRFFPLRNRIISGLSLGVVVVEAPEKSGALITASAAAEQGRDVMAVPGPVIGGRNRGGHLLIRDGARIVESAADVLQELGLEPENRPVERRPSLLGHLPEGPDFTIEEVAELTGEAPEAVLARLLELELDGRIQRVGGGRFARVLT